MIFKKSFTNAFKIPQKIIVAYKEYKDLKVLRKLLLNRGFFLEIYLANFIKENSIQQLINFSQSELHFMTL